MAFPIRRGFSRTFAVLILGACITSAVHAASTLVVKVDAGVTLNTFKPLHIFGNNAPAWADPKPVQAKIQGAGNYLLRIPGGSWGDVYHWNTQGAYDAEGNWAPSDTEYAPSKLEKDYQPKYGSVRAVDGKTETAWLSHVETDAPDGQWLYLDLGEKRRVDQVEIQWGNVAEKKLPYAKKFSVQYWDPKDGRQWMVYGADKDAWKDVKTDVKGKRGRQAVPFPKTETQYVRILLKESSAGKNGAYSVAEYQVLADGKPVSLAAWNPCVSSSISTVSSGMEDRKIFGFEEYMDFMKSFTPPAVPLVIVNFGTGTPQEAAAWVHYANKVKNYGIKYWEIGNEVGGHWEGGGPVNSRDYARRYILFYEAMKAEDPSITIIAQTGVTDPSGAYDGKKNLECFVSRLAKDKKEKYLDSFSIHQYPNWEQPVADLLNSPQKDMASLADSVKSQLSAWPQLADTPIWFTEFNTSDHVRPDISVHLENGLWLAQYLSEVIRHFGSRGYATMWDVLNGGSAIKDPKGADHGYLQAEEGPYQYQERADYWAMKMLSNYWAAPGDDKNHALVRAISPDTLLAVYADMRPDGKLSLLVVNKDPVRTIKTALKLSGFKPAAKVKGWRFDKRNYDWSTVSLPYHASPSKPPTEFSASGLSSVFTRGFPPYSITVLQAVPVQSGVK